MPAPSQESSATRIVLITFPDRETARQIGTLLIKRKLAACITLIPEVTSIYSWGGSIHESTEVQAILKTSAAAYPYAEKAILKHHPYDTPEIIALTPSAGLPDYTQWINKKCRAPTQ